MHRARFLLALVLGSFAAPVVWAQAEQGAAPMKDEPVMVKPAVTFVELGSVNCIPCRQMQPVMKAIEEKYGRQVRVVFHDVWKPDQRKYAEQYGVRVIPTQVFLDEDGKEFARHEGYYPEAEIHKLLQKRGLKIAQGG